MSDLDDLPPLREVIAAHNLRAEKSLGQNFLLDLNITDKIARAAGDLTNHHVIEIGPGPGGLTRSLLKAGAQTVTAIELDSRAVAALTDLECKAGGRLRVIQDDASRIKVADLTESPRKIVANLPYNIATPLLIEWLRDLRFDSQVFDSMTLMFQKEVAQRIIAKPGTKAYGRLSIISQWLCDIKIAFDLPPSAFTPSPKVKSSVVHFKPRVLGPETPSYEAVERLTAAAFGQRRKMIRSSLKNYAEAVESLGIDSTLRAEVLDVGTFLKLASL